MAIRKVHLTAHRAPVSYWRIRGFQCDIDAKRVTVLLDGYVDEQARRDGCPPLVESASHAIEHDDTPVQREMLYTTLKTTPDWAGAEDC